MANRASSSVPKEKMAEVFVGEGRAAVRLREAFQRGFREGGDIEEVVASVYAPVAKILPPNHAVVEGQENINAFWVSQRARIKEVVLTNDKITKEGDLVIDRGTYRFLGTGGVLAAGTYRMNLQVQPGGELKWIFSFFSSSSRPR